MVDKIVPESEQKKQSLQCVVAETMPLPDDIETPENARQEGRASHEPANAAPHTRAAGESGGKKKTPKQKKLASMKSPIIDAIVNGRYVFKTKKAAEKKIRYIEERFVKSTYAPEEHKGRTIMWIRGYDLTKAEKKAGCIGNYALIYSEKTDDDKWTLKAQKLETDPGRHPQRKREKAKHPDWGYWVLRRIKKNWRYETIEEAYADLMTLAEDFPEVSIPAQNKLYTIIYRKADTEDGFPLFKVILEVENLPEGGFTITCKENTFTRDKPKETKQSEETTSKPQGKFTSMVELKRNKRTNIADATGDSEA